MNTAEIAALVVLFALLGALAINDFRTARLPNRLMYPGIVAAAAAAPILPTGGYVNSLLGGFAGFAAFAVIYFARPGIIGGGDVKLAAMVGLALGFPHGLVALAAAPVLASVVAIPMLVTGHWTTATKIPYGPYICIVAAAVAVILSF